MPTRLKVCCIADADEARLAVAAGADALGLVSAMPSGPGVIDEAAIADILPGLPPPVEGFVLTSLDTAGDLADQARRLGARTLQIVREVDPDVHARLADTLPHVRRVQVVHVEDDGAVERAREHARHAHALLLDSGRPGAPVAELGGTGRRHDWSVSRHIVESVDVPVFLAGGIRPDNVAEAIRVVRPFGIDLCSGVRTDGRLDRDKLAALIREMREADSGRFRRES